jgi:hypothetical protein
VGVARLEAAYGPEPGKQPSGDVESLDIAAGCGVDGFVQGLGVLVHEQGQLVGRQSEGSDEERASAHQGQHDRKADTVG